MFKKFFEEFKKFAIKGSVIDLAVGLMIGTSFNKIVSSLVNDLIMPFFGIFLGQLSLADVKWVVRAASEDVAELSIKYGLFIQTVIDFLIIAVTIFIFVKLMNSFRKKEESKKAEEAALEQKKAKEAEEEKKVLEDQKKAEEEAEKHERMRILKAQEDLLKDIKNLLSNR